MSNFEKKIIVYPLKIPFILIIIFYFIVIIINKNINKIDSCVFFCKKKSNIEYNDVFFQFDILKQLVVDMEI